MCGIFCVCSSSSIDSDFRETSKKCFENLKSRGPDDTQYISVNNHIDMGFHRLAINGLTPIGNQPFNLEEFPGVWLICNGEIYNHKELASTIGYIEREGTSDCEIIIPLYKRYGFEKTLQLLDGVFAIILYDSDSKSLYVGRDRFGIRPLFMFRRSDIVILSSELKGLSGFWCVNEPCQVLPGTYSHFWINDPIQTIKLSAPYYLHKYIQNPTMTYEDALEGIRSLLRRSVKKRMMADRPIACLLSGGLDSSLITALVNELMPKGKLETFSIGFECSTDLKYARKVADYLGTKHTEIVVKEEDFLNEIKNIVYTIESYDTTSVRASVGNYLVSKYISQHSDAKVIFNGDGSDELFGSYLYFKNAPTSIDYQFEVERLLKDICYFDVLRSDRSISDNGLEPRTPFLDKDFVNFCMSIPIQYRMPCKENGFVEKHILRVAFDGYCLLPDEVLWRQKEAFSDGVSSQERSWRQVIQEYVEDKVSDDEMNDEMMYLSQTRKLKESVYYMKIFDSFYRGCREVLPYYWLPKWVGNVDDPSARILNVYKRD